MYKVFSKSIIVGLIALVLVTAVLSAGITAGVMYSGGNSSSNYGLRFDPDKVNAENIKKYDQVRSALVKRYYEDVDENTLLEGSIAGMADSLKDPYTVYFNKDQMKLFMEKSEGSYVGIGVSITMDNNGLLTIVEPFEGSPAKKAGIIQGDKIIRVNDKDVTSIRDEDMIIKMIKGAENTNVKITVYRSSEGKSIDFEMQRKRIKVENIRSELLPGNIGYIKIIMFDGEIAKAFEDRLTKLLAQKMKGLIIDVRDNPGGAYEQVIAIADRLIPKGLIVYTEDKQKNKREELSSSKELGLPIVMLVNGNSASASEILAGAVKDNKKGTLVGTKTFGKGLVQEVLPLSDGSGLKVTVARYFTPSGVCIQGIGIVPDEEVQPDEKYKNVPVSQIPREDDTQFKRAVEVMQRSVK